MGKKTSKIDELREAKESAAEELRLSMIKGCELGQQLRALAAELNRCADALRRGEIRDAIKALKIEQDLHNLAEKKLHEVTYKTAVEFSQARRRLTDAERTLRVIKNPSPWSLGNYNKAQIAAFAKRAREVVRELG